MRLSEMARGSVGRLVSIDNELFCQQLKRAGLRPGAELHILNRTASRGFLVRVDDTRIAISRRVAHQIFCEDLAA